MKRTNVLQRLAVVASSLLLVGGFVSYRAGAFETHEENNHGVGEPEKPRQEPYLYDGTSKSMTIFHEYARTRQPSPTVMSGSKSLMYGEPITSGTTTRSASQR